MNEFDIEKILDRAKDFNQGLKKMSSTDRHDVCTYNRMLINKKNAHFNYYLTQCGHTELYDDQMEISPSWHYCHYCGGKLLIIETEQTELLLSRPVIMNIPADLEEKLLLEDTKE